MRNVDRLYSWLEDEGVIVIDAQMQLSKSNAKAISIVLSENKQCGIFVNRTLIKNEAEEYTVILHEGGHYATDATHGVCSPLDLIQKHEIRADKWAINHCISVDDLDDAIADGCTEWWQLSERFGVTEDFVKKAVCWYTYGNVADELYF